jgi:hypothetical protein
MNLEKFSRYPIHCQNTISNGLQTLVLLKETLRLEQERNMRFELEQSAIDLNKAIVSLPANASSYTIQTNGGKNRQIACKKFIFAKRTDGNIGRADLGANEEQH